MENVITRRITLDDLEKLQKIGRATFEETFSESNSEENMKSYLEEGFSKEIRDLGGKRLFLHAYMLTVPMPDGGEMKFQAPVDDMWAKTVERLSVV